MSETLRKLESQALVNNGLPAQVVCKLAGQTSNHSIISSRELGQGAWAIIELVNIRRDCTVLSIECL